MSDSERLVAQTLVWATDQLRAVSDTPRLDAELLLAHALGWSRAHVLAEGRQPLTNAQRALVRELVARRAEQEPIAYITGHKEFYGLDLLVDQSVLVPRPETELLVELALDIMRQKTKDEGRKFKSSIVHRSSGRPLGIVRPFTIVDMGTGSGAIAVALATYLPGALVCGVDLSPAALDLAWRNATRHGVAQRMRFILGDLLEPITEPADLIVSNPPYTILAEISAGVRRHEPHLALDGGPDGLAIYRRLLAQAPEKLRPDGAIALEIGVTQAATVVELARAHFPMARIEVHRDLAGRDRVVTLERAGNAERPA